jgi:hypothetical protein
VVSVTFKIVSPGHIITEADGTVRFIGITSIGAVPAGKAGERAVVTAVLIKLGQMNGIALGVKDDDDKRSQPRDALQAERAGQEAIARIMGMPSEKPGLWRRLLRRLHG